MKLRDKFIVACFIIMCLLGSWRFGSIRMSGPSGGVPDFGPINGRDAVVANAVPSTVTKPFGAVDKIAGALTQTYLNAQGANARIWLLPGTHTISGDLAPLTGQWIAAPSDGSVIISGQNDATSRIIALTVSDVRLLGGHWTLFGNASSGLAHSVAFCGPNWIIEDGTFDTNFNRTISLGTGNQVRRCRFINNGRYGLTAGGGGDPTGLLIERCEISNNNTRQLDPGHDASATKFFGDVRDMVFRECYIHDNIGFGWWQDSPSSAAANKRNNQVRENVIEDNHRSGLFFEGVGDGCVGARNYLKNNGSSITIGGQAASAENCVQIRITNGDSSAGSGVRGSITRNLVDYDLPQSNTIGRALVIWNHDLTITPKPESKNWDINFNQFWFRQAFAQRVGGLDNDLLATQLWSGDIDFFENEYHVIDTTTAFWKWDSGTGQGSSKTNAQWQTFHPADNLALITI